MYISRNSGNCYPITGLRWIGMVRQRERMWAGLPEDWRVRELGLFRGSVRKTGATLEGGRSLCACTRRLGKPRVRTHTSDFFFKKNSRHLSSNGCLETITTNGIRAKRIVISGHQFIMSVEERRHMFWLLSIDWSAPVSIAIHVQLRLFSSLSPPVLPPLHREHRLCKQTF